MGSLFGTDGVRGVANTYPITCEAALNIGRCVTEVFKKDAKSVQMVIARDTRSSGTMLECALAAGICSMGGRALLAGVLPTPGLAYVVTSLKADAGFVISASHNPYTDNGIKVFNDGGYKLSDERESEIENLFEEGQLSGRCVESEKIGETSEFAGAEDRYVEFLKQTVPGDKPFAHIKIVLDCANGATFRAAPRVFSGLGADTTVLFDQPDGFNINRGCGSQQPEILARKVVEEKADIGLAFDGDGDRLIAVDENGKKVTGDQIMAICANDLKQKGKLKNNRLVSTVMSNIGFRIALDEMGIQNEIAPVGDRYVLEKMFETGAILGGEDSGHMIFLDDHTTGDGILSGIKLVSAMVGSGKPVSELSRIMSVYPQVLINVEVSRKPDLKTVPEIDQSIKEAENLLGDKGRVLVRYSGTRSLCRVMAEGPTMDETQKICRHIAKIVQFTLGKK